MIEWHFHNTNSGEQICLTEDKIKPYIQSLTPELLPFIFAWCDPWPDWIQVSMVESLMQMRKKQPPRPPPRIPSAHPLAQNIAPSVAPTAAPTLPESALPEPLVAPAPVQAPIQEAPKERRQFTRHQLKLKVVLVLNEMVFRTHSSDISENGIRLTHPIPEKMLGQQIEVYISSPDLQSSICLSARFIPNQREFVRLQFGESDPTSTNLLKNWIHDLTQKKMAA